MKRKFIAYAMLPILGAGILGMSAAHAHPMFGMGSKATPEEIATRQQDMFQKQADLLRWNMPFPHLARHTHWPPWRQTPE